MTTFMGITTHQFTQNVKNTLLNYGNNEVDGRPYYATTDMHATTHWQMSYSSKEVLFYLKYEQK